MIEQIDAPRSWWLDLPRERFSEQAKQEHERMAKSPISKVVYSFVVGWGPSISGGFKMRWKFNLRDRVQRRRDVFNNRSPWRYGRIQDRYTAKTQYGEYDELYAVEWEDGEVQRGFLRHGLHCAVEHPAEPPSHD